ncbi:PLP-dependent aminotransferase family protein [Sodalis sp. RH22]|uniref:MocR-like pyridoxine biosynthesis transcription factor PdxR n=1 Tax=unclassified Sodalis (in: enterobacteria) TaxID=2636512 RepID=UPI0039B511F5
MRSLLTDMLLQHLSARTGGPLHRRLYDCIRLAILDGGIRAGSRLPPTRDLAKELALSRNTVSAAYEQLLAEGYIFTRAGSGTFVTDHMPDGAMAPVNEQQPVCERPAGEEFSARGANLLARSGASPHQWGAFMPGVPDVSGFPHGLWRRIHSRLIRRIKPDYLTYSRMGGSPELQQALVDYLRVARSVNCSAQQIIITEGTHQAVDLLAKMLCNPGDRAWIEEPSYWGMRNVLTINGVDVQPVPVDDQGLNPPDTAVASSPRLICVTPSHQYPTGAVMSLQRRQRLLALAQEHNAWVIEDDYDSEFRFSGNPIPALQSLAPQAPVIYIGTFSKTLYPGLRISYMVLPPALAQEMRVAHAELYRGGHWITQLALAQFIAEGHYASHIRRMRLLYGKRRAVLSRLILQHLGADALRDDSNAGLHLVMSLPDDVDDVKLSQAAGRQGVYVRPLSTYYLGPARKKGLLLGYACVDEERIESAFMTLLGCMGQPVSVAPPR